MAFQKRNRQLRKKHLKLYTVQFMSQVKPELHSIGEDQMTTEKAVSCFSSEPLPSGMSRFGQHTSNRASNLDRFLQ